MLAALVLQVFVLQGLHQYVGHDHETETCSVEGTHVHAEGHGHLSCDICLFHFAPTDLQAYALSIQLQDIVSNESQFTYHECRLVQENRQSHLRGPPVSLA